MAVALLKNLADLSRKLNEGSDLVSQRIAQLESALNDLKLGVAAWVEVRVWEQVIDEGTGQTVECEKRLGYDKHNGKWGFILSEGRPDWGDDYEVVFLREAPRDDRLEAVEKIPHLIQELEAEAEKLDEKVASSAKAVESMIKAMGK